ncbi:MAG: hypothetical protein RL131_378, partial [Bacteroidota bacterium]
MFAVQFWIKQLPFEYPFTISKGTKTHQSTFVVELTWNGIKSYGEAPAISYYHITAEKMAEDLTQKIKFVESFNFTEPKRFWHFLHHLFPANPFLVCALDMAGWDLYGKIRKKPLYEIWGLNPADAPATDYTIGNDSLNNMIDKIKAHPSPIYKIKVGCSEDMEKLKAIRSVTPSLIRIDANAGWKLDEALNYLPELEKLNIELIEQPLAKEDWEGHAQLKSKTTIPILADESFVGEKDLKNCIQSFSGINIKLTKCSGITPSLELIKKAKSSGLKIMLGCMNESSIGTAAMAHISPLVDYLDADGPLLLSSDLAKGITLREFSWI